MIMNKKEIVNRLKNQFGMGAEDYYKWLIIRATEAERLETENAKLREETMTEKEKLFLEDTRDILVSYDGCHTEQQLKGLIDETRERLSAFLSGKIQEYEDSL